MRIHIYKVIGMFEVDTASDDPIEAKEEAMKQIGEVALVDPDLRWIAIAHQTSFIGSQVDEKKEEDNSKK